MAVSMTITSVSSVAVVGIRRSLAVAVAMAITISMAVSMTISSVSSVSVVGISISRPLAVAIAVVTISAIAIASVSTMAVISVARLGSSFWLSNSHSSCLSVPLAIVAMVSIPTISVTISAIAIARLGSSSSLSFPLAIIAMAIAV